MMQFREISTYIDCAEGTLITADGVRISRDDYLPKLILADEVMFFASFNEVHEENNVITLKPKKLSANLAYRIIGDSDYDGDTEIMFASAYIPEESDLENGILAFRIKSNTVRFSEAMKRAKSLKGVFVILAKSVDTLSTVVLAKDNFIAENRPCEEIEFEDIPEAEIMTKEELQVLLGAKAPLQHTHKMAEITDLEIVPSVVYSGGSGIKISDNIVSVDTEVIATREYVDNLKPVENSFSGSYNDLTDKPTINGVELSGDITINTGETAPDGDFVTQDEFDTAIGDINSILDEINGEEV